MNAGQQELELPESVREFTRAFHAKWLEEADLNNVACAIISPEIFAFFNDPAPSPGAHASIILDGICCYPSRFLKGIEFEFLRKRVC